MSFRGTGAHAQRNSAMGTSEAIDKLFGLVIDDLAKLDLLSQQSAPSFFIVYAHDSKVEDAAKEGAVLTMIKWLKQVGTRILCDKAPLHTERADDTAAAYDIVASQFCLLPQSRSKDGKVTSVSKVVVFFSSLLEEYYRHDFTKLFIKGVVAAYNEPGSWSETKKRRIQDYVLENCNKDGFHHVLTELAFLQIRQECTPSLSGQVIPVSLDQSLDRGGLTYLPYVESTNVFLKVKSHPPYTVFFQLLDKLYPKGEENKIIRRFRECFETARKDAEATPNLTEAMVNFIAQTNLTKAHTSTNTLLATAHRGVIWKQQMKPSDSSISERDEVLRWLRTDNDSLKIHTDNLDTRRGETGGWILKKEEYSRWKEGGLRDDSHSEQKSMGRTLWCHGRPGAGKSILTSVIIDDLETCTVNSSSGGAVAYVFCKGEAGQTAEKVLLTLVAQLIKACSELPTEVHKVASKYSDRTDGNPWAFSDCKRLLVSMMDQFDKTTFLIVDGLDEILGEDEKAEDLPSFLSGMKANTLLVSRKMKQIERQLPFRVTTIDIEALVEDVQTYIELRLKEPRAKTLSYLLDDDPGLKGRLQTALAKRSCKTFLLPKLNLNFIFRAVKTYENLDSVYEAVESLPSSLAEAYDKYIGRITNNTDSNASHARDILAWVIYAKEPVTMSVIAQAIAILRPGGKIQKTIRNETLFSYCEGLLDDMDQSDVVSFVHLDALEFFRHSDTKGRLQQWIPFGQERIAEACLTCLVLPQSQNQPPPLWEYAAKFWGCHIPSDYGRHESSITTFLSQPAQVTRAMTYMAQNPESAFPGYQFLPLCYPDLAPDASSPYTDFGGETHTFKSFFDHSIPSSCHGAHAAAFFGLLEYFSQCDPGELELRDSNGWTPLWWAVVGKHDDMVELLLNKGARIGTKSSKQKHFANWMLGTEWHSTRKEEAAITLEKDDKHYTGSAFTVPTELSFLTLSHIFTNNVFRIVTPDSKKNIIERLSLNELNSQDENGDTLIMTAAKLWDLAAIRQLLGRDVDLTKKNIDHDMAFSLFLKENKQFVDMDGLELSGNSEVHIGSHIFFRQDTVMNLRSFAVRYIAIEKTIESLIPSDFEANSLLGKRALQKAIINRYSLVVDILLKRGAKANTVFSDGMTPLHLACSPPMLLDIHLGDLYCSDNSCVHIGNSIFINVAVEEERISKKRIISSMPSDYPDEIPEMMRFESIVTALIRHGADVKKAIPFRRLQLTDNESTRFLKLVPTLTTALSFAFENQYLTLLTPLLDASANISNVPRVYIDKLKRALEMKTNHRYNWVSCDMFGNLNTQDYCTLLLDLIIPWHRFSWRYGTAKDNSSIKNINYIKHCGVSSVFSIPLVQHSSSLSGAPSFMHNANVDEDNGSEIHLLLQRINEALENSN